MGIEMMDNLGIDQSQTEKVITWGTDVTVPMVPMGYWTESRIQSLLTEGATTTSALIEDPVHENVFSPLFGTSDAKPAPAYTEAIYLKLDLMEVAKRDGADLTLSQQAQLLQVLTANEAAFQGRRGDYTGGPVGIMLKPDAKPHRARPYPVPLKN